MKAKYIISVLMVIMVMMGTAYWLYAFNKVQSDKAIDQPTVFVHGYKGTYYSFGNMLNRFEQTYEWGHTALIYEVSPTGKLTVHELSHGRLTEPVFVQVIFRNNRATVEKTTDWLAKVLCHMNKTFQMGTINLVGHSMGSLVALNYSELYHDKVAFPDIQKLIAIGGPFDGIYNESYFQINQDPSAENLKPGSRALKRIQMNKHGIPDQMEVLSIGSTGDTVAEPESVRMIQDIVNNGQLVYKMIHDPNLGHSELHEDPRVDRLIYHFLQAGEAMERRAKD